MSNPFQKKYDFETRKKEADKIKVKYPNRYPIIVNKAQKCDLDDIERSKFLVPGDLTIGQFIYIVRKRITGSIVVSLGDIISGGIVSVFISQVFINFHDYAVLFALIISATILLFASIMSSAPKIKITRNEVLIAGAGILTLIVIIASVAASQH